jgi:diphosphomevalonate decarboxylase
MTRQKFIDQLLKGSRRKPGTRGEAFAPANIALCKYWGKRDAELNLPANSSLSISLGKLGTRTVVKFAKNADRIFLNGKPAPKAFTRRVLAYLDLFRKKGQFFEVRTKNNIPTATGLASSASGFAALIQALNELMGWKLRPRELSMLARLGSGSAARSLYDGFAVWHAGQRPDGMDSYAEAVDSAWPALRIGILEVSAARKEPGSTEGMNRTRETSELYQAWPAQAACDFDELRAAIAAKDFPMFGKTAENNAMAMHATMLAAWPPLCYWKPRSLALMQKVWEVREYGFELYFTMDAGPNLKLLFLENDARTVRKLFPKVQIVTPFPKA